MCDRECLLSGRENEAVPIGSPLGLGQVVEKRRVVKGGLECIKPFLLVHRADGNSETLMSGRRNWKRRERTG
jgi:hypothetical protein